MKLIEIHRGDDAPIIINPSSISCISSKPNAAHLGYQKSVFITMACGETIKTLFTDVAHAVDYVRRAHYEASLAPLPEKRLQKHGVIG